MRYWISVILFFLSACHSGLTPLPNSQGTGITIKIPVANVSSTQTSGSSSAPTAGTAFKGVSLVCWSPRCYESMRIDSELNFLQSVGANALAIVPTWYQATGSASEIAADPARTAADDDIRFILQRAKQRGFKILLKPHVDVSDGSWRGHIDPADLARWQASYQNFILHYAGLAQELGVDVFSVGTELKRRSPDLAFWQSLIGNVKTVYRGKLTYAANWDEFLSVGFWDRLDFIGIDFYYPIADSFNATQGQMEDSLRSVAQDIQNFSLNHRRPVFFTEIGYRSVDGAATRPYDFEISGPIDLQEQADAYAAVLTVFGNRDWFQGIFWWREDPRVLGGPTDDGYLFYGKPAADVLRHFWRS